MAFASQSLTEAEQRYSQTEKEAVAIMWAEHRFDQYVCAIQFAVETDHQPLVTLLVEADLADTGQDHALQTVCRHTCARK